MSLYLGTTPIADGASTALLSGKADIDLSNVLSNIDFVVESKTPTANDPTWYRVYKSGWVEQGGKVTFTTDALHEIALSKPYANTDYTIQLTLEGQYSGSAYPKFWSVDASSKAAGSFKVFGAANNGLRTKYWETKGQGA